MRRCRHVGCNRPLFAADECLDHYVAHHHELTRSTAQAVQNASGNVREVAHHFELPVRLVWEIRSHRWWGNIR